MSDIPVLVFSLHHHNDVSPVSKLQLTKHVVVIA